MKDLQGNCPAADIAAHDYFTDMDVDRHVVTHLGQVKVGLGVN